MVCQDLVNYLGSALVPDVAAKSCLPQAKSPGPNIGILSTYFSFATITIWLYCPQFYAMDRHHLLQLHWHCVTMTSLWSHTVSYTQGCRGLSPTGPARVHHKLTLFTTTLFCWPWVCQSHIAGSILPGALVPFSAQKLLFFFQPHSVYNKANIAPKLRFEVGLYFCFLRCTRKRQKTPNYASKLSFSPRIKYRIRRHSKSVGCVSSWNDTWWKLHKITICDWVFPLILFFFF